MYVTFSDVATTALLNAVRQPGLRGQRLVQAHLFGLEPAEFFDTLAPHFDCSVTIDTGAGPHEIRAITVDSTMPSPFASALLFGYVANYIYDGDAPLAERRAQALSIDQGQLRELLGEAELRELLDADALAAVEAQLQQLDERYRALAPEPE